VEKMDAKSRFQESTFTAHNLKGRGFIILESDAATDCDAAADYLMDMCCIQEMRHYVRQANRAVFTTRKSR
jgi:hypothetical protein